jgi:hypothetical protein
VCVPVRCSGPRSQPAGGGSTFPGGIRRSWVDPEPAEEGAARALSTKSSCAAFLQLCTIAPIRPGSDEAALPSHLATCSPNRACGKTMGDPLQKPGGWTGSEVSCQTLAGGPQTVLSPVPQPAEALKEPGPGVARYCRSHTRSACTGQHREVSFKTTADTDIQSREGRMTLGLKPRGRKFPVSLDTPRPLHDILGPDVYRQRVRHSNSQQSLYHIFEMVYPTELPHQLSRTRSPANADPPGRHARAACDGYVDSCIP